MGDIIRGKSAWALTRRDKEGESLVDERTVTQDLSHLEKQFNAARTMDSEKWVEEDEEDKHPITGIVRVRIEITGLYDPICK